MRKDCKKLDINSLGEWCKDNDFHETYAHGTRALVTNKKLLAKVTL